MFKWVDHVIIAVNSLDQSIPTYEKILGKKPERVEDLRGQGVRAADFYLDQGRFIELVEPLGPDTPVGKGLARRGEGVWCIAMAVDDMQETIKQFKDNGTQLIEHEGGAFIHPKSANGVLIQLIERK